MFLSVLVYKMSPIALKTIAGRPSKIVEKCTENLPFASNAWCQKWTPDQMARAKESYGTASILLDVVLMLLFTLCFMQRPELSSGSSSDTCTHGT